MRENLHAFKVEHKKICRWFGGSTQPCKLNKAAALSSKQVTHTMLSSYLPVTTTSGGALRAHVPSDRKVKPSLQATHVLPLCVASAWHPLAVDEQAMQSRQCSISHCTFGQLRHISGPVVHQRIKAYCCALMRIGGNPSNPPCRSCPRDLACCCGSCLVCREAPPSHHSRLF